MTMGRTMSGTTKGALQALWLLLAISASAAIAAQPSVAWRAVAAGVEHAQLVREKDSRGHAGPWNINILRIDPTQVKLDVVHARRHTIGLETVRSIATRLHAIAAVNGGYFRMEGPFAGDSTGTLQIDGKLLSEPDRGRAAVGLIRRDNTTRLVMGHVKWEGLVKRRASHAAAQRPESSSRPQRIDSVHT